MKPRKLGEEGYDEITDIEFVNKLSDLKFIETQKYVDFNNNVIVQTLPEFKFWNNSITLEVPL
jgi:hypothetical protein